MQSDSVVVPILTDISERWLVTAWSKRKRERSKDSRAKIHHALNTTYLCSSGWKIFITSLASGSMSGILHSGPYIKYPWGTVWLYVWISLLVVKSGLAVVVVVLAFGDFCSKAGGEKFLSFSNCLVALFASAAAFKHSPFAFYFLQWTSNRFFFWDFTFFF